MNNYVVAAIKDWNVKAFEIHAKKLRGNWYFFGSPDELTAEALNRINPRYIFFPHWSWLVPNDITNTYECVCFHMTDVPYGRGGSPLQNLIMRGHKHTKLTALRMASELDAGPVYGKIDLSLDGSAQAIYERAGELVYGLISRIIETEKEPVEQQGEVTLFHRRAPEQSLVPVSCGINKLFDHVRMLDATSYPHAYIEYDGFKLEFTNAKKSGNELNCSVRITKGTSAND
jgi:methionyl-tRNA formyltransferase